MFVARGSWEQSLRRSVGERLASLPSMRFALRLSLVALGIGCVQEEPTPVGPAPLVHATLPDTTLPEDLATDAAFRHGVVTAAEPLAALAGAAMLADGGNAIDAAVAVMFMLNVVEPQDSGIGGGGFMLIHLLDSNETRVLNCRERAPKATSADMFASQVDPALRASSGYAVGVPGTVACGAAAIDNWGTMSLAEVLQPAIAAAANGIPASPRLAYDTSLAKLDNETDPNSPVAADYDVARAVLRPHGAPLVAHQLLVQPDLANTLELIAAGGPDAFYRCDHVAGIAEAIIATQLVTRTANPDGVGRMTCDDLESYEVEVADPISRRYRGYDIVTIPPPSAGGIALLQALAMLETFPIGAEDAEFGFGEFATLNVMIEAMRLAHADRQWWVGDETCDDCFDVPVQELLADAYLAKRAASIELGRPRRGLTAGDPEADGGTTHASIIDRHGNIVTFMNSIEATWGTGLMVPGYGFLLNNQLTDFNPIPTFDPSPDAFNPGANDPGPDKRPRSSAAPTIIFLDGEPIAAYGSPGGARIISAVLNATLNLIDHRMTLQASVAAPRISVTSALDEATVDVEDGFALPVILGLRAIGYSLTAIPAVGAVQAIVRIPSSGKQYGAADARRIGGVVGL